MASTTVQFGDGVTGARLAERPEQYPRQVSQRHRRRRPGQSRPIEHAAQPRPLGVKGVTNPLDAGGAQDPEQLDDARANAPLKVLTLDRIVSLQRLRKLRARLRRHRQGLGDLDLGRAKPRRAGDGGRSGRRRGGPRQRDVRQFARGHARRRRSVRRAAGEDVSSGAIFVSPAISRSPLNSKPTRCWPQSSRRCASNFPSPRAPSASR